MRMKLILLFTITSMVSSSLFLGSEANIDVMIEGENQQSTKMLYGNLLEELNGAHLRIAASHLPPTMIIVKNEDGTFNYSGHAADACVYIAEAFKFTYSFVNTPEIEVERLGSKEAEASLVMRDIADIATTQMIVSLSLFNRLDISIPLYAAGPVLMVPWPGEESRLLATIRPFQSTVWLILGVTLVTMAFIFTVLPRIYDKFIASNNENDIRLLPLEALNNQALSIAANITSHGGYWSRRKQLFYRLLLGTWCLMTLVLVNAYSSLLISYLTIPTLNPAAKNYDDLTFRRVQKNIEGGILEKNSLSAFYLLSNFTSNGTDSKSKIFRRAKIFAQWYRSHPETLFTTYQQKFNLMYTGRYSYASNEQMFYTFLDDLNKKAGYCKITASATRLDDLIQNHYVFLFRKNWRYTDAMRNKMQRWSDFGLANHWLKSYQPSTKGCLLKDYKENAPAIRVLTLKDLSSAFVILLLGCTISFLAFLIENRHYTNRQ